MGFESGSVRQLQADYELNILIVEDNLIDSDVAERYIASTFPNSKTQTVISLADTKLAIFDQEYDFIILDLNLPDSKGLDTLDTVIAIAKNIPVLIYTSIEDTNMALQAIEHGAQDYLLKGRGDAMTLKRVIQYSLVRKHYERTLRHKDEELHQLLDALKESKATLEHKVAERTSRLEVALHELSKAQAAKSEFFTNITHELRTPLHAIINFSSIGKRKVGTVDEDRIREYFEDIHTSGDRLLRLVNDVLDVSKHESGKMKINCRDESLEELFGNVKKELSGILENNAIQLVEEADVSVISASLHFDMDKMHQLLTNLISNSIKFSPKGSQITVSAHENLIDTDGVGTDKMVVISVKDQGDGIPENELESVFDEFAQSNKVKSGAFSGGTGLGLAICRQIVQAHGGEIWAKNNEEGGAGVYFTLPSS